MTKKPKKSNQANGRSRGKILQAALVERAAGGLAHRGFQVFKNSATFKRANKSDRYVRYQFTMLGPWGGSRKDAYIFYNGKEFVFEAKHQEVSGSTDEKVIAILHMFKHSKISNYIILFEGDYWSNHRRGKAIIEYLRVESKNDYWQRFDGGKLYICTNDQEWYALADKLFDEKPNHLKIVGDDQC